MLVISTLSLFFPVWSQLLNFLSHLRHSARFRFAPHYPLFLWWSSLFLFLPSYFSSVLFLIFVNLFLFPSGALSHPPTLFFSHLLFLKSFFVFCFCLLQPLWSALHLHHSLTEKDYPVTKRRRRPPPCQHPPNMILRLLRGTMTALCLTPLLSALVFSKDESGKNSGLLPSNSWEAPTSSDLLFPHSPNNSSQLPGIWPILSITDVPSPDIYDLCSQASTRSLTLYNSYTPLRHRFTPSPSRTTSTAKPS